MDDAFLALLRDLPPKRRVSKLEPYAPLIHELRRRGRGYREIVAILDERCGMRVGLHTLYNFVRVRARKEARASRKPSIPASVMQRRARSATGVAPRSAAANQEAWARIAALKERRPDAKASARKEFAFDENQPLQLIPKRKPERT